MARREKKPVHKVVMTEGKRNIIQQLLREYDIETAEDIQDCLLYTSSVRLPHPDSCKRRLFPENKC